MRVPFNAPHFSSKILWKTNVNNTYIPYFSNPLTFHTPICNSLWNWLRNWVSTTDNHIFTALLTHYLTGPKECQTISSEMDSETMDSSSDCVERGPGLNLEEKEKLCSHPKSTEITGKIQLLFLGWNRVGMFKTIPQWVPTPTNLHPALAKGDGMDGGVEWKHLARLCRNPCRERSSPGSLEQLPVPEGATAELERDFW